jgi:hypothetical protein
MTDSEQEAIVTRVLDEMGVTDFGIVSPPQMQQLGRAICGALLQAGATEQELVGFLERAIGALLRDRRVPFEQREAAVQQLCNGFECDVTVTWEDLDTAQYTVTPRGETIH